MDPHLVNSGSKGQAPSLYYAVQEVALDPQVDAALVSSGSSDCIGTRKRNKTASQLLLQLQID